MADATDIQPDPSQDGPPQMSPDLPPDHLNDQGLADQDVPWSQVWQLPVLLFGLGLLVIGIYSSLPTRQSDDFASRLADVELYVQKDDLATAEEVLETELEPRIHEAEKSDQARFWELYGDVTFEKLYETGIVNRKGVEAAKPVYEKIVGHYGNAREAGAELTGTSLSFYIRSLVAIGKEKSAMALLDQMTGPMASQRYLIVRDLIGRKRDGRQDIDVDSIMSLLQRFRNDIKEILDKAIAREQEIWADSFQASLQMELGDARGTVTYLLRRIHRLAASGGDDDLSPLIVLLGKAYYQIGEYKSADQQFRYAQQKLKSTDDLNAEVLVGLGRLALAQVTGQEVEEALEYFREAEENYPAAEAHIDALLGRAVCEARLGSHAAANRYFELAVQTILEKTRHWDRRRDEASIAINTQFQRAVDQDLYDRAKDYLDVLALLEGDDPSEALLLNMATTCERIAERRLAEAQLSAVRPQGQRPLSDEARKLANQQSRRVLRQGRRLLLSARLVGLGRRQRAARRESLAGRG